MLIRWTSDERKSDFCLHVNKKRAFFVRSLECIMATIAKSKSLIIMGGSRKSFPTLTTSF